MAGKFVLTAEVQLQSPKNLSRIASDINKALSGSADIRINTEGASRSTAELKKVETQTLTCHINILGSFLSRTTKN